MIEAQNLGKQYPAKTVKAHHSTLRDLLGSLLRREKHPLFWAIKGISFTIQRGEIVGIVGPNGSGKSTLLSILSRVSYPTTGSAAVHGKVASMLEVGSGFHPDLTGRENIFLQGALLGMKRRCIAALFDEIVAFSGIEPFIDTEVKFYSSGMITRLGFAIGSHLNADILFLDETLSVGDAPFQKRAIEKMKLLSSEGKTILFVSHSESLLKQLANRGLFLSKGELLFDGAIDKALMHYRATKKKAESYLFNQEKIGDVLLHSLSLEETPVSIGKPLRILLDFSLTSDTALPHFALSFYKANGELLFQTLSNTENERHKKPLGIGRQRAVAEIPANLFNSERFSLSLTLFDSAWKNPHHFDHLIEFEAHDDGALRGDFFGSYGGSIRPSCPWRFQHG